MRRYVALALVALPSLAYAAEPYAMVSPPPESDGFSAECRRNQPPQTCVCMAGLLQKSAEGQFAIALAGFGKGGPSDSDRATLLARHHVAPAAARAFAKASKASVKTARFACHL